MLRLRSQECAVYGPGIEAATLCFKGLHRAVDEDDLRLAWPPGRHDKQYAGLTQVVSVMDGAVAQVATIPPERLRAATPIEFTSREQRWLHAGAKILDYGLIELAQEAQRDGLRNEASVDLFTFCKFLPYRVPVVPARDFAGVPEAMLSQNNPIMNSLLANL